MTWTVIDDRKDLRVCVNQKKSLKNAFAGEEFIIRKNIFPRQTIFSQTAYQSEDYSCLI